MCGARLFETRSACSVPSLQDTNDLDRSADLGANANATLLWRYFAPPAIDVFVFPQGGCAVGMDCLEVGRKCSAGADGLVRACSPTSKRPSMSQCAQLISVASAGNADTST